MSTRPPREGGDLMLQLRHGLRQSRLLAEHLSGDPLVGAEARTLLGRIEAIQQEIEAMGSRKIGADNGPFWRKSSRLIH